MPNPATNDVHLASPNPNHLAGHAAKPNHIPETWEWPWKLGEMIAVCGQSRSGQQTRLGTTTA
jgi:hypothetical protein